MNSKALCLLVLASFLGHVGSEVIMEVFPEEVIPGVTPTFTLRCSTAEIEPAVVSLQIKRTTQSTNRHIYETLATLNSTAMNSSVVASKLPGLTAHGMLSRLGVEVLPFIEITWQNPSINDLGTYVCDAMLVGEMGSAVPMSAFISVTTQSPVSDRLLHLVSGVDNQVERLVTLFTSLQKELSMARQHNQQTGAGGDGGSRAGDGSGRDTGRGGEGGTGSSGSDSSTGGGSSVNLPDANILHIYVVDQVSYVLWESTGIITAEDAMNSCSSAGLYLTEINSEREFREVTRGLGKFIPVESRIVVGGQRMDRWVWPHTGGRINYRRGINSGHSEACLSMMKVSPYRMVMDSVSCEAKFKYYLCSVDEPLLQ